VKFPPVHAQVVLLTFEKAGTAIDEIQIYNSATGPVRADSDFFDEPDPSEIEESMGSQILPPNQQISQGVAPQDVTCKDNLQKLYRHDGSPVCVTESGAEKLIERGWMQ